MECFLSAILIDGKKLAKECNIETAERVKKLQNELSRVPKFSLIIIGDKEASIRYVKSKDKLAKSLGIDSQIVSLNEGLSFSEIKKKIIEVIEESDSVLLQLPVPQNFNEKELLELIPFDKDPDGLSLYYEEKLESGQFTLNDVLPCTPIGVTKLIFQALKELGLSEDLKGKIVTVLGRSKLVGMPTVLILKALGAKVYNCHSKTSEEERKNVLLSSDIIVSAVGKKDLISSDDVKPGSIVIDVGINYDSSGNLSGDVDFERVKNVAAAITPVPGGVGPMTLAMLMRNVIILSENQTKFKEN